jgi:para-aminobenzoate synthetase/4-amino-4-deoxychorismate lyase
MKLILRDARERTWLAFASPREVIVAARTGDVEAALARVDAAVAEGAWAAGFLTYEAAPAFDSALTTRAAGALPPVMFGIFDAPRRERSGNRVNAAGRTRALARRLPRSIASARTLRRATPTR